MMDVNRELMWGGRFRTLIFWVYDDMDILGPRLDRRIDKMIEVSFTIPLDPEMHCSENVSVIVSGWVVGRDQITPSSSDEDLRNGRASRPRRGYLPIDRQVPIPPNSTNCSPPPSFTGYKEFSHISTSDLHPLYPLFAPAVERMKLSTRQYAKKQIKWIKNQLIPAVRRARELGGDVSVYLVRGGESLDAVRVCGGTSWSLISVGGSG